MRLFSILLLCVVISGLSSFGCTNGKAFEGPRLKIVLDPGHGGRDSATKAGGFYEKDIVLNIAREIKAQLLARGHQVIMTRDGDEFIPLTDRAKVKGDVFISLHANTVPERIGPSVRSMIKGIEVFTESNMPSSSLVESSKQLAGLLCRSLGGVEGINLRGNAKQKALAVLRSNNSPAVLVELGYLTNLEDLGFLTDPNCYKGIATAFCDALDQYQKTSAPKVMGN